MGQSVTNTFIEGMNKDLDKSLISNKSYLEANNFRVTTTDGGTTGSLENIKGNRHIAEVFEAGDTITAGNTYYVIGASVVETGEHLAGSSFVAVGVSFTGSGYLIDMDDRITAGQMIIGGAELRDYTILFTTNNTRSQIYKLEMYLPTESMSSLTLIYDDELNIGAGTDRLGFSAANPIKAIGRHETSNIQKVYWTDDLNNVRYAIVSDTLTKTGGAYVAVVNPYMSTDKFEFSPNFTYSKPVVTDITGGTIYPGMVQYTYQLYKTNGAETTYSPLSNIVHITDSDDFEPNSEEYKGSSDTSVTSGKGCKVSINNLNNLGFDRARVIRVHYASLNATPSINIVSEEIISTSGSSFTIIDSGSTLGELTVDELTLTTPNLFSAEDIAVKDNRLFVSNITESVFDIGDFDSRAIRFRSYTEPAGGTDTLYNWTDSSDSDVTCVYVDDNTVSIEITNWPTWASIPGSRTVFTIDDIEELENIWIDYTVGGVSHSIIVSTGLTAVIDTYVANFLTFHVDSATSIFSGLTPDTIDYMDLSSPSYDYTYTSVGGVVYEEAQVVDKDGSTITIDVPTDPTLLADWATAGWDVTDLDTDFPLTHDAINLWNDPTFYHITGTETTPAMEFVYQTDLTTVGAEGPNILLEVTKEDMVIDEAGSTDSTYYANIVGTSNNPSYSNYASPFLSGSRSWQRGEVYRFYAVYHDAAGQTSFPQWICDFKMPGLTDVFGAETYELCTTTVGETVAHLLRMKVTFRNLPTGTVSAQIYAVPRTAADRSIVTQALATNVDQHGDGKWWLDLASVALNPATTIIKLVSPEININQNLKRSSTDYLEHVGNFAAVISGSADAANVYVIYKLQTFTPIAKSVNNNTDIDDLQKVIPGLETIEYTVGSYSPCINFDAVITEHGLGSTGYLVDYDNTSWTAETLAYNLVNYRRNIFLSQYGGNTYEARSRNYCMPVSDIVTSTNVQYNVHGGDTFINFFDVSTLTYDLRETGTDSTSEAVYIPCESSINCDLRHDMSMHKLIPTSNNYHLVQEVAGIQEDSAGETFTQDLALYQYNTVYSQQTTANYIYAKPVDFVEETVFDTTIKVSDVKLNGELSDSWTTFPINNFIEVDSVYGPVNAIHTFGGNLYYFQDTGFGVVSVNPRSLITDNNTSNLVLGTGGLLDRYDYISEQVGCQDKFGIAKSKTSMYWWDKTNRAVQRLAKEFITLSRAKYMQSHFETAYEEDHLPLFVYDKENDEIVMTFLSYSELYGPAPGAVATESYTVVYNETVDSFVSFHDCNPTVYIPYKNKILTTAGGDVGQAYIFLHNSSLADRCQFWAIHPNDTTKYVDSNVEILFNPDYNYTKVFDNFHMMVNAWDGNNTIYNECFDTLQCYNDYQNTTAITLTYEDNLRRRERGWTTYVPRNAVDEDVSTDPDIFTDVDVTRNFRERMRDKYMITDLVYNNAGTYDKLVFSNITLYYRNSIR